ncbi:MAG TPA: alkaline phosphatase D family protein [Chitinophagales bacterium]|nr:alkaline phosphatase D family protein [Chitinophagales bacterium]
MLLPFLEFCAAQDILYAPVLGGATDTSVRILFFTARPSIFKMEFSTDAAFKSIAVQYEGETDIKLHNRGLVDAHGLKPSTVYYYRVLIRATPDSMQGHFKTFPPVGAKGHYVIATGSCQETADMEVYNVIAKNNPDVFIHTGDWTYPDYMVPGYPANDSLVFRGYIKRYTEKVMKDMMPNTIIDYLPDNHDGIGGAAHNHLKKAAYKMEGKKVINYFITDTITQQVRSRVIDAYADYFPAYPLEDTTIGVYHCFKMGNAEFFVIDIRDDATFQPNAFKYDSAANHWSYEPPPGHTIISRKQMDWLEQGLKNSTADWKFLVMGIPFNKNIVHLINLGIHFQDLVIAAGGEEGTGFRLAASWCFYWPGYPESQKELMGFIHNNNIKDVIVISGDTHHNVIDDGRNAGLPEINASGLSVTGTVLAHYMNLIGRLAGYPDIKKYLWDVGGNGVHNKNYKNAFGKVDIYGADSVKLSIVDENNDVVCAVDIPHSSIAPPARPHKEPQYMKHLERISFRDKPTPRMQLIKALARAFLHKKKTKVKGDID